MSGGRAGFLLEEDGDFVKHTRTAPGFTTVGGLVVPAISTLIGEDEEARIFPEQARQGAKLPHIVYTKSHGHSPKHLADRDGCEDLMLHVYAYSGVQPQCILMAECLKNRWLDTNEVLVGDGTRVIVCNGGVVDSGVENLQDSSSRKKFYERLVLKLVISD